MITEKQIENLKDGDKLIFFRDGGVLSAKKGNVFTFSNWLRRGGNHQLGKIYWQCKELHKEGNSSHNFCIHDTELFDEKTHSSFTIMDSAKIRHLRNEFIKTYGN